MLTKEEKYSCTGNRALMLRLTRSFPALANYPHEEWDPIEFRNWAMKTCYAKSERCAALFVAAVWNTNLSRQMSAPKMSTENAIKKARGFDLLEAITCWDDGNRRAFAAWAEDPWVA